jgi:hypothetical protein
LVKRDAAMVARGAHRARLGRRHVHEWCSARKAAVERRGEYPALRVLEVAVCACATGAKVTLLRKMRVGAGAGDV